MNICHKKVSYEKIMRSMIPLTQEGDNAQLEVQILGQVRKSY